jgi:cardiolipin-specific phospholipase
MVLFFRDAKYAKEKLMASEAALFKLAPNYGNRTPGTYHMELFDTPIPASSVPLKGLKDETLVIHGIRLDALDEQQKVSKYPLVTLHGYMNGALCYYRNLVGLTKYFPTVYSLDFLGWGLSSRPSFHPLDNSVQATENVFVESLEAWRKAQQIEKMVLAGHSMGGYLSVAYCEKYPERVERLILLSPVGVPEDANFATRKPSWAEWIVTRLFHLDVTPATIVRTLSESRGKGYVQRYMEQRYMEQRLPGVQDPDERQALNDYLYYNSISEPSGEYGLQRLLTPNAFPKEPIVHRIQDLEVDHIAFLYGEVDWLDASGGLQVQKRSPLKNINVYQVPKAGHLLMIDNWQAFDAAMGMAAGGPEQEGLKKLSVDDHDTDGAMASHPPQVATTKV